MKAGDLTSNLPERTRISSAVTVSMIADSSTTHWIRYRTEENHRSAAISQLLGSAVSSRYDRYSACGTWRNKYAARPTAVVSKPLRRAVTKLSNKPKSNK
jgi:hypothetical protein